MMRRWRARRSAWPKRVWACPCGATHRADRSGYACPVTLQERRVGPQGAAGGRAATHPYVVVGWKVHTP